MAESFSRSDPGRQRRGNEDALYARAPLFAVADGMGGAQAGEVASGIAVETLGAGIEGDGSVEERLAEAVRDANGRIHRLSRTDERHAGMGTTMTVVLVGEDELSIAHVGDSRAYRWRDGRLDRLTEDHSLVEELVRQGRLTPEEAHEHPQRSIITRALGPEPDVQVDTCTYRARDGDVLLLCSDGLTTMMDEERIAAILAGTSSLEQAGHALVDAANAAGGRDNITVVLTRLEDVGPPPRTGDQPTEVGLRGDDVRTAVATVARPEARTAEDRRLRPLPAGAPPPPDAPSPPPGQRERRRSRAWLLGILVAGLLVPIALGLLGATRSVYFLGVDDRGFAAVFRGLPYELPLGVELYQTNYRSGVPASQVRRPELLREHELLSQDDAYDLMRSIERGELAGR